MIYAITKEILVIVQLCFSYQENSLNERIMGNSIGYQIRIKLRIKPGRTVSLES